MTRACTVCGFVSDTTRLTCSAMCAKERTRMHSRTWDATHRDDANARRRRWRERNEDAERKRVREYYHTTLKPKRKAARHD